MVVAMAEAATEAVGAAASVAAVALVETDLAVASFFPSNKIGWQALNPGTVV